jgi:hypothetical protein
MSSFPSRYITNYPLKVRRLEQLDEVGLNVADFICFPPNELRVGPLRGFFNDYKQVSCRTFAADEDKEFKTPVKYEISEFDDLLNFATAQNKKYFVLVNEALPLTDSLIAGNIFFNSSSDFILEYFRGPGTPRDVDTKPLQHLRSPDVGSLAGSGLEPLPACVARFPQRPAIFEFSLYPYPVGRRKQNLIFWEWRKA